MPMRNVTRCSRHRAPASEIPHQNVRSVNGPEITEGIEENQLDRIRVALFACAYNEIDGVANTMRYFDAFAKSHDLPMLNIHGGFEQYETLNPSEASG